MAELASGEALIVTLSSSKWNLRQTQDAEGEPFSITQSLSRPGVRPRPPQYEQSRAPGCGTTTRATDPETSEMDQAQQVIHPRSSWKDAVHETYTPDPWVSACHHEAYCRMIPSTKPTARVPTTPKRSPPKYQANWPPRGHCVLL